MSERRDYIVGEVEHWRSFMHRDRADVFAQRLGYNDPEHLKLALERWQRHDLARLFNKTAWNVWAIQPNPNRGIPQGPNRKKAHQ